MVENDGTGKTAPAGASNTPQTGAENVPEPVILEEHIVGAAPVSTPAAPKTAPVPPTPNLGSPSTPETPQPAPIPLTPKPTAPAPISSPPASAESPATTGGVVSNIATMLQMIKLPERKRGQPTEPKRTYDTSLSIDPKSQAAADAARAEALRKASAAAEAITESLPNKADTPVDDVRALHTLKDDLQHVVRDKKISLVRAVALEEEKRHHGSAVEEHLETQIRKQKRTRYSLFLVSLLFFLGCVAIGAVLYVMAERTQKTAAPITAAVLFSEQSVPLPVDNLAPADLRREIGNARGNSLTLGAILQIIPVHQTDVDGRPQLSSISFSEFLSAIGAHAPQELPRALSDQFFLGLHTVDENAPLIVVPVISYERAFAAMLAWEKDMNADLSPIFTPVAPQAVGSDGLPVVRKFDDTVMRNYDVRALKDDSGTIQLYYSFPTRNVLIIAESPYSFSEILSRLRADRKL